MNKSKSIAVVCNYELNPNRIGGMDRFFKAYNDAVLEQGHQLTWFFSGNVVPVCYSNFHIFLARDFSVEEEVLSYLKSKNSFDIVVTHFIGLCTSFYRDLKRNGVERIVAVDHNPRPLKGFSKQKRLKNKAKGLLYGKFIDAFVGVSGYTKKHIMKDYGKDLEYKINVIHNGIDYQKYIQKEASERGNKKFVVVSHLRQSKGIQDLLKALAGIPEQKREGIKIDIFGEGPYEAELRIMCKDNGLENVVSFCGSSSDLPNKLHEYDYLLQPTHMECFSLSLLEGIAANIPVITTDVGGNLELIENEINGFIFEAQNVPQLTTILRDIFSGKKAIEGDIYQKIEQDFSLEKMLQEHVKITICT